MKRFLSFTIVALMCVSLFSACTGGGANTPAQSASSASNAPAADTSTAAAPEATSGGQVIEIVVPHYKVGENSGAKFFLPQVERFNAKYEGVYKITVEEVPQDMYPDKMKQLGLQNMLPPLIEGCVDEVWLTSDLIPNSRFYDLNQWLDKDPAFKDRFIPDNLAHNTKDGKLFSLVYPVVRPTTMYYNSEMVTFSKSTADMTWDELLSELGDNKIAFMSAENAWTTMIALTSMVAVQPGGAQLLIDSVPDDNKIKDFTQPIMLNAITELQKVLQTASAKSTVGAAYADAANTFMSKNAALICNGSWMVNDFAPESSGNWSNGFDGATVRSDVLPGNVGLDNVLGYGWWIPASTPADQAEAAWAFIEFMMTDEELETYMLAEGGTAPRITPSAEFLAKRAENKLLDEYVGAVNKDTIVVPYLWNSTPNSIADVEFGKLLPKLIDGSYTPLQFCEEINKKIAEIG